MYSEQVRRRALGLLRDGATISEASRLTGVSRSTIKDWREHPVDAVNAHRRHACFVCLLTPCPSPSAYAYLLGQYLGDGYLVTTIRVPKLRVSCADTYPAIAAEVDATMRLISGNATGRV